MKQSTILALLFAIMLLALSSAYGDGYLIQTGDTLRVTVLGEPDLTKSVVVTADGNITLPLVSEVKVAGLSTVQAAEEITRRLKEFIKNPQVTLEVAEPGRMQVTVSGQVFKPGVYPVPVGSKLVDVITIAGGYTQSADLARVKVSRADATGTAILVDLNKFLLTGDASVNIPISPGDTVVVPALETPTVVTVTVLGAVRQPGQHQINPGMTLREAVMLAGGPTEFADLTNVTLRHDASSDNVIIDLSQAAAGNPLANPELKPGDVIYIAAQEQFGYYTIQGAVVKPGQYDLKGKTSITEAIAIAGGVRDRARLNEVRILRSSESGPVTVQANVSDIMAGKSPNVVLENGDDIYIAMGKEKPDYFRILSLVISLGWLISRASN